MAQLSSQTNLSPKPLIPGWKLTAEQVQSSHKFVEIVPGAIPELLPWLEPGPANSAWRDYVSPVDDAAPDLNRLFFELALTISQFGGFIGFEPHGVLRSWKRDGSGVKAILFTMDRIRGARKLPGIDIHSDYDRELAHFFIRTSFGKERLDILAEVGTSMSRVYFRELLETAKRRDGSYRFNVLHMRGLGCRFPMAFGEDPVFYKKASLLLMTMEIALNQLGERAIAETLPPADYRIPQMLEGLGILKFTSGLSEKIKTGHVFRLEDPEIHAIRAATVEAVGVIKARYEQQQGRETTCAEIDGLLYLLSRNQPLMSRHTMKPHMLVATAAF